MTFDAMTVINQLAGSQGRLVAMTGAKQFVKSDDECWVRFMFMRSCGTKARYCKITLNGKDLYDVEFYRVSKMEAVTVSNYNDVYAEDLKNLFETETGLYLTL